MPPAVSGCINTAERPQKIGDIFPLEPFQIYKFYNLFISSFAAQRGRDGLCVNVPVSSRAGKGMCAHTGWRVGGKRLICHKPGV